MINIIKLIDGWELDSSSKVGKEGDVISLSDFETKNWLPTKVPSTVLNTLVENGIYKDIYMGDNLEKIPTEQFEKPWWYRKVFHVNKVDKNQNFELIFEGINYRSDIWLNGNRISDKNETYGGFRIFSVDVSKFIKAGDNVLALEVFPPKPAEPTIGFVDWNPTPPDQNMGIWREVKLRSYGDVSIKNPFIKTDVSKNCKEAVLEFQSEIRNHTSDVVEGRLKITTEDFSIEKEISLEGSESKKIVLNSEEYKELIIKDPKLWWPHNFGDPYLHNLKITFETDEKVTDEQNILFGIRDIEEYLINGHKGFRINGKEILIKGGGWVDNLLLADSKEKAEAQILYAKHVNLNTIRLEGFWGNSTELYDLCDKHGMLLMPGWSCHWEWQNYYKCEEPEDDKYGCVTTDHDIDLVAQYTIDHILWLRNHPSIFIWGAGSDKLPHPKLEQKFLDIFDEYDDTRIYINSHQEHTSEITGHSAIKMRGPYDYVPPIYWYEDKTNGGAFGFNSETGPGPQPPLRETIEKMIPKENLWPIDSVWNYHCGRHEFNDMDNYIDALNSRYGAPNDLDEFLWKAQLMNYESIRPMFEAFSSNKPEATGVVQWMLNSAWPETYWQLYDYYLLPTAAFYGTKKAAEPLNLVYDYHLNKIHLVNDKLEAYNNLKSEIKIFDKDSKLVFEKELTLSIGENSNNAVLDIPEIEGLSNLHFLDVKLYDAKGTSIINNFYWLSQKVDKLDYSKVTWYVTPISEDCADFKDLDSLTKVELEHEVEIIKSGNEWIVKVELKNNSDYISFFNYVNIIDKNIGESVKPIFWDDNYVSLLPKETKVITAKFEDLNYSEDQLVFELDGYNLQK